nr:immunoglobulin heavy chain junction region [Mus musculus]MBK4186572.1 immunoglobulin heavy chain junction region [Mus musculus]
CGSDSSGYAWFAYW